MPDTRLILHIKGTERQTTELPKQVVRAAISQGQITHSQLIWSPTDNAWKQVRELPHLLPSQKLAPAPAPRVGTGALPKVEAGPRPQTGTIPRVAGKASAGGPKVKVAVKVAGGTPVVQAANPNRAQSKAHLVVKEEEGSHPLKWISIGLGVLILATLVINYFLVDQPLVSHLGQTPYSKVTVYGHLGAFMQPNVLVIHIPVTSAVNADNLTDFLVALAKSTPPAPVSGNSFDRVALTPGWTAHYSFSGYAWKQLGDMDQDDDAHRKEFLLDQMCDPGGNPMISTGSTLNEDAQQAKRDKIWATFAAEFVRS